MYMDMLMMLSTIFSTKEYSEFRFRIDLHFYFILGDVPGMGFVFGF